MQFNSLPATTNIGGSCGLLKEHRNQLTRQGPAAVLIAWIGGITSLGIYGNGELAAHALSALSVVGGLLIITLGQRV